MSRIDESYEGYDELGNPKTNIDRTQDSVDLDNAETPEEEQPTAPQKPATAKPKAFKGVFADLVGQDKQFQTIEFLKEQYRDEDFDKFFAITTSSKIDKMINYIAGAILAGKSKKNGEYTAVFGNTYGYIINGISKFLLPKGDASSSITFFDALYMFGLLIRTGTNNADNRANAADEKGFFEGPHWDSLYNLGYGQVNEAPLYSNMISFISEFNEFPILQGYLKEAYHKTQTSNTLRDKIKNLIMVDGFELIKQIKYCSEKVYANKKYGNLTYIPYTDMLIDEDSAEKNAVFIINSLRNIITDKIGDESYRAMDDITFWTLWAQKNDIKNINYDVATASGSDSIIDEIANRFRVLLHREGESNKKLKDDQKIRANIAARERRANVIGPGFDIEEKLQENYGLQVSQEDIEEMREISLGEWFKRQSERAEGVREPASILKAMGPFTIESINNLYNALEGSMPGGEEEQRAEFDERKEASAFDFFATLFMASKDGKMETALIEACRKLGADMWFKFENTQTAKDLARTKPDMQTYMENLGNSTDTAKLSLDMVAYKDTKDGFRNFVAIEYQGEQHYRPNATASISIDDLYNANFSKGKNGDAVNWPGYWKVISTIINISNGWYQRREINESQEQTFKTDRKGFLNSCINTLEMAISGKDNGRLKALVQKECDGYTFDDGYEDTFSDWIRKDRPQDKKKPIKNGINHFANSYYRWWCELDTFIQSANDLSKFEKTNQSLFTIEGGKPVGKCGLFYVCPNNARVIPIEVIGNAISNPYRAAFLSGYLTNVGINIETINEIYHRTFRSNGKNIDLKNCKSIADGTTLFDAINGTLK